MSESGYNGHYGSDMDCYDTHATDFVESTRLVDMQLPRRAHILDDGCGSGRAMCSW